MFQKVILVAIILCSLLFFQLVFLPDPALKLIEWAGLGLVLLLNVVYVFYGRGRIEKHRFAWPILIIYLSVLISMFASLAYHNQSLLASGYGQRAVYFYLFYFLLHFMKVEKEYIIRLILFLGLFYALFYVAQYAVFPARLTSTKVIVNRGTIRIMQEGTGYLVIAYLIWLYKAVATPRFRYYLYLALALVVFVLMGTRQIIASMVLLTLLFLLQSKIVKSKFLIIFLVVLASIPVYFLFQNIIDSMFEVTRQQGRDVEGNVRVLAAKYFLGDFIKDPAIYFTGNGGNGKGPYGMHILKIGEQYGFYQADIGLIGDYSKFGALFVLGVAMLLTRVFRARLPEDLMFIKYNYLGIVMTIVTGGGAFGGHGVNIVIHSLLFFLIDDHLNRQALAAGGTGEAP